MPGIDYRPENALEQAIHDRDIKQVMYAIAEETALERLAAVSNLGDETFPDEVVFSVMFLSLTKDQVKTMGNGWFWGHLRAGERIRKLREEAIAPLPNAPTPGEKALIKAIVYRENEEIIRLIEKENAFFCGFAPELLIMLPELSREAVLAFFQKGLCAKLKAIVLRILLKEAAKPDLLKSFSYEERIRYANLMLHIIAGEPFSAETPWFPDDEQTVFNYYFDPLHRFHP